MMRARSEEAEGVSRWSRRNNQEEHGGRGARTGMRKSHEGIGGVLFFVLMVRLIVRLTHRVPPHPTGSSVFIISPPHRCHIDCHALSFLVLTLRGVGMAMERWRHIYSYVFWLDVFSSDGRCIETYLNISNHIYPYLKMIPYLKDVRKNSARIYSYLKRYVFVSKRSYFQKISIRISFSHEKRCKTHMIPGRILDTIGPCRMQLPLRK